MHQPPTTDGIGKAPHTNNSLPPRKGREVNWRKRVQQAAVRCKLNDIPLRKATRSCSPPPAKSGSWGLGRSLMFLLWCLLVSAFPTRRENSLRAGRRRSRKLGGKPTRRRLALRGNFGFGRSYQHDFSSAFAARKAFTAMIMTMMISERKLVGEAANDGLVMFWIGCGYTYLVHARLTQNLYTNRFLPDDATSHRTARGLFEYSFTY